MSDFNVIMFMFVAFLLGYLMAHLRHMGRLVDKIEKEVEDAEWEYVVRTDLESVGSANGQDLGGNG